jgi:hypothetical protein
MISVRSQEAQLEQTLAVFPKSGWSRSDVHIFYGQMAPSATATDLNATIFQTHYDVVHQFVEQCVRDRSHLLVMENDCLFTRNVNLEVQEQLNFLDKSRSEWHLLLVGHIASAPLLPIRVGLMRSLYPFEAHCYILNYRKLASLLHRISREVWRQPFMVEGWRSLPTGSVFSIYPNAAVQGKVPRAWPSFSTLRFYWSVVRVNELFMLSILPSLVVGLISVLCC